MKISIIIPTLNREKLLERTLLSISQQNSKEEFEVIVIDNGSTDGTKEVCDKYSSQINNLIYQFDSTPGLLTGRHRGLEMSSGELLCFLDDDVDLNVDYVDQVEQLFERHDHIKLATGPCHPYFEIEPPSWLQFFWEKSADGIYCPWLSLLDFGKEEHTIDPNFVWGLNFCIRKVTALELGGFHPDSMPRALQQFQGDGETGLTRKAQLNNCMALYAPGLSLHHYVSAERLTVDYFKKRAYFEGVSKSFASLRAKFLSPENRPNSLVSRAKSLLWPFYYILTNLSAIRQRSAEPRAIKQMKADLHRAESEGYKFHQKCFHEDEAIREWVLRPDYLNADIPLQ